MANRLTSSFEHNDLGENQCLFGFSCLPQDGAEKPNVGRGDGKRPAKQYEVDGDGLWLGRPPRGALAMRCDDIYTPLANFAENGVVDNEGIEL